MSKVGFVGLGIMGTPMAAHLIAGGHQLFLYDRKPPRSELTSKGALACASAKEVAQRSEVVIIMVPDTPDVGAVLFSANGVAAGQAIPCRTKRGAGPLSASSSWCRASRVMIWSCV